MTGRSQRHLREVRGVDSRGDTTGVSPADPVNTVAPAVTGTARVGFTLTTTNGTWRGEGITFTRQWRRGSTSVGTGLTTYVPVVGDIGSTMTCRVTATNYAGAVVAVSNTTAAVIAA